MVGDADYRGLLWGGADFVVAPGTERAIVLPIHLAPWLRLLQVAVGGGTFSKRTPPSRVVMAGTSDLVLIDATGVPARSEYFPTAR